MTASRILAEVAKDTKVYSVIDAARANGVRAWVLKTNAPAWCLYAGKLEPAIEDVAPWLLRLGRGHAYVDHFFQHGWPGAWGSLVASDAPSKELRRHLRRFLKARTEDGKRLVFRYYDPRVLRVYLPTLNAAELKTFFGPVQAFATPDKDPRALLVFTLKGGKLDVRRVAAEQLEAPAADAPPELPLSAPAAAAPRGPSPRP